MNIYIFSALRKVNRHIKKRRKDRAGQIMSPVRRIEFVAPPKQRMCAMTFDDGPTAGLTSQLLDSLKKYNASAAFDVIGSTAENYPDTQGALGSHYVFGTKYDHYSSFGKDDEAGALACPDLLKRIADEGHEIANHGYRHILFGPEYYVYRKREYFRSIDEVVSDLQRLHDLVKSQTGYEIKMARPPHYVDRISSKISRKYSAYTAYGKMGYHYMAASIDGGGWLPSCGDYNKDVQKMVEPLKDMLEADPNSLSGAVIFQKDGYNMSMEAPVADALGLQLSLLAGYGYKVVGVGELLKNSPFEDVPADDEGFEAIRSLDEAGYCIGFQNNRFKPDEYITAEQLEAMCTLRSDYIARTCRDRQPLTPDGVARIVTNRLGQCGPVSASVKGVTRRDAAMAIYYRA